MSSYGSIRDRWLPLALLCAGSLMIILDGSIVTVALPAIQRDLGFTQTGLAWVVNAYLVAFGGLLLLAGRVGDLIGRRRIFLAGIVLFTVASLACGLAADPVALVVARFVQGAGGALTSAVALGMIVTLFPGPGERAAAIGVFSFVGAAGSSIGLLAGGVLTGAAGWQWIFFVNVPVGAVLVTLAARRLAPDTGTGSRAGADVAGAVLVTAGLMLAVASIVGISAYGWFSVRTLLPGAAAVVLLAAFVARQATARRPLLPLRVFRSRELSGGNLVQLLMVAAFFGFQFLLALYLQRVLGYDPFRTGLAFLPTPVLIAAVSLGVAARVVDRYGARAVLLVALAAAAVGFLLLARLPVDGRYAVDVLPAVLVLGAAAGLALPAVTMLAMSGVDPADAGLASGVANTTQQVGGALGLAVLATVASARADGLTGAGGSSTAVLAAGYRAAFGVAVALLVVGALIGALVLRPGQAPRGPAGRPARRVRVGRPA